MNSFFITLLLKTDPELKNEDIMGREVKRLFYLNTQSLGFKTTKQHSKVFFLLKFCHDLFFSAAPQKPLEQKLKLILIHVFAKGYFITCWHRLSTSGFLLVISTSRSK